MPQRNIKKKAIKIEESDIVNVGDNEDVNEEMILQYDESDDNIDLNYGIEVDYIRQ